MGSKQGRNIVIIGGGVIGSTTAYFLTRHPKFNSALDRITLLEASGIAGGASGKAGGLLALWAYPSEIVPLSYRLHKELAEQHGGAKKWGYRRVECGTIVADVTAADLKAQEQLSKSRALAKAEKASTDVNGENGTENGVHNGDHNGELPTNGDGLGSSNGPVTPLPIQTTQAKAEADEGKRWEKLPKQDAAASGLLRDSPLPKDLDYIDPRLVMHYETMGRSGSTETAQVHPYHFTTCMAELAQEAGVDIKLGAKVTRINHKDTVESVAYLERGSNLTRSIDKVTDVIVTAGPWTGTLLPRTSIQGLRAHSVVWEADVAPYAVFTDIKLPTDYVPEHRVQAGEGRKHKGNVDPEIYARPFNEVYACGEPDTTVPLPPTSDAVRVDEGQCDDLIAYVSTVSPALAAAPVKNKQACYLPRHMRFGDERGPLIGPTATRGLWIASGHTCWGIQNGPGTGFLVAEMLMDGAATSANIEKLDPRKYKI